MRGNERTAQAATERNDTRFCGALAPTKSRASQRSKTNFCARPRKQVSRSAFCGRENCRASHLAPSTRTGAESKGTPVRHASRGRRHGVVVTERKSPSRQYERAESQQLDAGSWEGFETWANAKGKYFLPHNRHSLRFKSSSRLRSSSIWSIRRCDLKKITPLFPPSAGWVATSSAWSMTSA